MQDGIFIAAPPGSTWPLAMAGFEAQLRARWPEVQTAYRTAPATKDQYLAFEIDLDAERRHGAYFDHRYLLLEDGPPAFWADTIVWFLSLLPADADVVCMTEGVPEPSLLPQNASPELVVAALQQADS